MYRRLDRIFSIGGWTIFYRRLEHIVAMIGTHMVPTVGSLPTATRRGFAVITAAVPPFLVFACCKLVRVGFAKHGEDGNEQNPALLLCRVAQESFGSYNIVFYGYSSDASVSWLLHYFLSSQSLCDPSTPLLTRPPQNNNNHHFIRQTRITIGSSTKRYNEKINRKERKKTPKRVTTEAHYFNIDIHINPLLAKKRLKMCIPP